MNQARLLTKYHEHIVPALKQELGLAHALAVPRLTKIVVSCGITDEQHRDEALANMSTQLSLITGQKPVITKAKQSIAGFKLRAGDSVGLKVTLRGRIMYEFFDKLITIVLPRVKDFQGLPRTAFDNRGNYSLGLSEQIVFPEVEYDKIDKVRGLQITLVTTSKTHQAAMKLLELFGLPFTKEPNHGQ